MNYNLMGGSNMQLLCSMSVLILHFQYCLAKTCWETDNGIKNSYSRLSLRMEDTRRQHSCCVITCTLAEANGVCTARRWLDTVLGTGRPVQLGTLQ